VHLSRGEYEAAERCARASEEAAARLRLTETRLIALALRVCVAAHRGRRERAEQLHAKYRLLGGDDIDHAAAVWGLGLAFSALLEEDRERAWLCLRRAIATEDDRPPHYLSFNRGPHLLLATLAGTAGRAENDELASSAHGRARWNRQFVMVSRAVLEGREGHAAAAAAAMAEFESLAAPYPLAHHLGLRLAGERASADGWGEPAAWLATAETYFQATESVRVAAACRGLLREMGAPVRQRRRGSDRIPVSLRRLGVTVREHEVLDLVAERLGNKEIAGRLFLSPRTVEKHVASLLVKTGQEDRAALVHFAAQLRNLGSAEEKPG
jgi:DNA-binding CsgD family transcriptional regulator